MPWLPLILQDPHDQVRGVLWKQSIPSKATDCSHNPLDFKDSLVSKGIFRFQGKINDAFPLDSWDTQ